MSIEREPYPWELEVFEWSKAKRQPKAGKSSETKSLESMRKGKMSNIIRFAKLARKTPEVWNLYLAINERILSGENVSEEEDDDYGEANELCARFARWFQIKNGLTEDFSGSYGATGLLLKKMAAGEIDENDVEAIRSFYSGPFVEDDLNQ